MATSSRTGRLPNNIIKKAPNADKLDGVDSSVLLDRYTRAQVDAMPSSRLLGFGIVGSSGVLDPRSDFPGGSATKAGTGLYIVRLAGYGPGCDRPFPVLTVTPQFGTGEAFAGFGTMNCTSGDVSMQVNTANSAGTATDRTFATFATDEPHLRSAPTRHG